MIKGIGNNPYIDLDEHLDVEGFTSLHPEICRGFAEARDYAKEGTWIVPGFDVSKTSYIMDWKPIYQAFEEYQNLPDTDPIKIEGNKIYPNDFKDYKQRNLFTRYLKTALSANDPYVYYFLWEEGDWNERNATREPTDIQKFFPGVTNWVENLIQENIISRIGRVIFFVCDHNGRAFEHRDLILNQDGSLPDYTPHNNEFIHIRPRTKRGFYIWDPDAERKVYINSQSAFWNDQDWHGGENSTEKEYGMRVDCVFTEEFRKKIGIDHIEEY